MLRRLDAEFADVVPPQFADSEGSETPLFEVERTGLRLCRRRRHG